MHVLLRRIGVVTAFLIALNVAVSVVGFWALRRKRYRRYFLFIPSRAADNWIGTVLSHFAHGDLGHLFVNMLALYLFGPRVERALGPVRYLALYALCGVVATFAIYVFRRNNPRHSALGASGAISGIVFAAVVIAPSAKITFLLLPIALPAPVFALLYLVASTLMMGRGDHVAHEAHVGGALAGFVLGALLFPPHFGPLVHVLRRLLS